jgi:hypothetical protein
MGCPVGRREREEEGKSEPYRRRTLKIYADESAGAQVRIAGHGQYLGRMGWEGKGEFDIEDGVGSG